MFLRRFNTRVRRRNRRRVNARSAVGRLVRREARRTFKRRGFRLMKQVQMRAAVMFFRSIRTVGTINFPVGISSNPEYYLANFSLPTESSVNDQLASVANLYRWYKPYKAILVVRPVWSKAEISAGAGNAPFAQVISAFDRSNQSTPISGSTKWETMRSSGTGARETFGGRVHVRKWKPRPTEALNVSLTDTSAVGQFKRNPWVLNDTGITNAPIYGGPLVAVRVLNNAFPGLGLVHSEVELKTYWVFKDLQLTNP
nr:Cap [Kummerowia striata CRESS virus]